MDVVSYLMSQKAGRGGGGGGDEPKLPVEYQEVEYLHADGNSWCTINVQPVNKDEIEVAFSLDADASTSEAAIVGINSSPTWEIYVANNNIMFDSSVTGTQVSGISRDVKYTVTGIMNSNLAYPQSFYWGRYRTDRYPFLGRLYSCRLISRRGEHEFVYCKLVACRRKSDNVLGFYDVINSVFYTNSSTGTFTPGPDVN